MNKEEFALDFLQARDGGYTFFEVAKIVFFIIVFLVICSIALTETIRVLRDYKIPYVHSKIEFLRENIEKYDTVVIGTSRVFRGFDPEAFDNGNSLRGCSTRTFNLGIPNLRIRELDVLVNELSFIRSSGSIKRILFDPQVNPDSSTQFYESRRGAELMQFRYVPLTVRNIWADNLPQWLKVERTLLALRHFLSEGLGVGHLSRLLFDSTKGPEYSTTISFADNNGYIALDLDPQLIKTNAARIERFQKPDVRQRWLKSRDRVISGAGKQQQVPEDRLRLISEFTDRLALLSADVQFLLISQPILVEQSRFIRARLDEKYSTSSMMIDPDIHPNLFHPNLWFDEAHFTAAGAKLATDELSKQFCESDRPK